MKRLFCFFTVCSIALLHSYTLSAQKNNSNHSKPNIILIVADDLGYGDVGCYGQKTIRTPHIDEMAKQGMRFTQFYAGCPVCAPSRSALMTGQHTGHTPVRGNIEIGPEGQWPLPDSSVTIAMVLKKAGYVTGDFGKWGLGFIGTSGDPLKKGFDVFFAYNCQRMAHNYYPDHLWQNDTRINYPNTPENEKYYSADIIHRHALQFIEQNKNKSFFLFLSYTLPHPSLQVPHDSIFNFYKNLLHESSKPVKLPWNGKGYEPQPYPETAFATMVTRLDDYVGQVLSKLKALGLDKNTLVIFTSDNGPHKEGGEDPKFFNSSGGFKGIKRDVYEGGIREPMIAWWPGKIKAGSISNYIGASWDFMPTFDQLVGVNSPKNIDGISFLPALFQQKNQPQHKYLYWEFHEEGGKQGVRMGKWKGVRLNVMKNANAPVELYNLEQDPHETNNIATAHPDIVATIKNIMQQSHVEEKDFPFFNKVK